MAQTLRLDLSAEEVSVWCKGRAAWRRRSSQWVEFYGRLLLAERTQRDWVTAADVAELRSWKAIQPQNVGKSIARHLQFTKRLRACVVESQQPTLRWRLADPTRSRIEIVAGDTDIEEWLRDRGVGLRTANLDFDWLRSSARALVAYGLGQLPDSERHAWAALRTPGVSSQCRRVAGLLVLRAASGRNRTMQTRRLVEELVDGGALHHSDSGRWGQGAFGDYIRARLSVLEAIDSGPDEAPDHIVRIRRRLEKSEHNGNLSVQVVLTNALGLLASRTRHYREAQHYLNECIVFCLGIGDIFTLGGAMFNLAVAQLNDGSRVSDVRPLVELCVEMDKATLVGRSSAQAEILLARLHIDEGDVDAANVVLSAAASMIAQNASSYDRGCYSVAAAKLLWAKVLSRGAKRSEELPKLVQLLETASECFRSSGRQSKYVDAQLEAIRRGEGISLSCLS